MVKLLEKYRKEHGTAFLFLLSKLTCLFPVIALKLKATKSRYFFEVSKSQEHIIKSVPLFKFHQQLKNALCYTTDDLESMY